MNEFEYSKLPRPQVADPAAGTPPIDAELRKKYENLRTLDKEFLEKTSSPSFADDADAAFSFLDDWSERRFGIKGARGSMWTEDGSEYTSAKKYLDDMTAILARGYSAVASPDYQEYMKAESAGDRQTMARILGIDVNKTTRRERDTGGWGGFFDPGMGTQLEEVTVAKTDEELDEEIRAKSYKIKSKHFGIYMSLMADDFTPEEKEIVYAAIRNKDGLPEEWVEPYRQVWRENPEKAARLHYLVQLSRKNESAWAYDTFVHPLEQGFRNLYRGFSDEFNDAAEFAAVRRGTYAAVKKNGNRMWNKEEWETYENLVGAQRHRQMELSRRGLDNSEYVKIFGSTDSRDNNPEEYVNGLCADRLAREIMPREAQLRRRKEELMVRLASDHQPYDDYDPVSNAISGAIGSVPYMAVAAIPYAGIAINTLAQFGNVRNDIILNGGNPDDAAAAQLLLAMGWSAIEKQQFLTFSKPLTGLQKKAILERIAQTAWKNGKLGALGSAIRQGAPEFIAKTFAECVEEGLQGAIEGGTKQWWMPEEKGGGDWTKTISAALKQGGQDFIDSIGTMGVISLVGSGINQTQARRNALSVESVVDYAGRKMQVMNIMTGRVKEMADNKDAPANAQKMLNEISDIWKAHKGNAVAALDEMREKYGLTDDQARTVGDYLDLQTTLLNLAKTAETDEEAYAIAAFAGGAYRVGQTTGMGDTAYDVVDLFRMISPNITVEDIEVDDKTKAPVASPAVQALREERDAALKRIEEAKVGSQRKAAERELRRVNKKLKAAEAKENAVSYPKMTMRRVTIPVGKRGEKRSFVIRESNEAPDIHGEGYAQSAADAVKGVEGLKAGEKVSLQEFKSLGLAEKLNIAVTQEQYMVMSNEERAAYVSHFGLGGSGNFALLDNAGKEIFNSDAMISLFRGKVGTPGARVGGNWTLAHEYTHGVVRFLRDIGAIDEGTVALMRRLFGEPTSDNELWNEEAMANGFAEFLRGEFDFRRLTAEERREAMGFFERVWDIIKDFFRRFFGAEIDEPPVMASKRKEAERAVFNALRNGDLSGLDQYAGIEFEEEKREEEKRETGKGKREKVAEDAREAASKPSEKKTVNEPPKTKERAPEASTPPNTTKGAPKEPTKAETTATTDIAAVVEQIENPIATAANLPARTNTKMTIFTPGYEMEIECEMMWVPLNELAESTDDREVQMRDRSRRATDEQVRTKTRKGVFQPLALFPGKKSDDGAPIVGGGMKIISGHGRKRMLEQLASEGRFNEYLSAINAEAQRQGVPTAPEGMKNPVLVLRVTGGLDKKSDLNRFAELSNRWGGLERSGAELAESDARKITDALLRLYNPDASGNLLAASNRSFMAAFLKEVGATGLTNADGTPTPEAALRVQRALMTAIFGNDEKIRAIIQNLLEKSGELSLGNLQNALMRSAGKLLAMKRAKGSFDIVNDVREAAYHYIAWRSAQQKQKSLSFADYLSEQDMFAEVATPMQAALAKLLEVGRFGTVLDEYSKLVAQEAVDAQGAFDFAEKRTPLQLLGYAERNILAAEETPVTPDPTSAAAAEPVQTPPAVSEEVRGESSSSREEDDIHSPTPTQNSNSTLSTAQSVITPPEPETFTPAPLVRGTATLPGEGAAGIKAHQVNANGEPTTRVKELPAGAWNLLRAPYDVRRPPKASAQDKAGRGLKISNPPPVKWNDIFPHFQGNKTEMADRTSQAIRANMTKAEREHYTTVVDYFGGGGCWGLFHALANFPNAKTLVVNEFDPDRLGKIRLLHEIDGEVAEIAYKLLDERYEEIRVAAKDSSSPSTVANIVESLFKRQFTDPTERAAIQAFIDCAHTLLATSKDAQGNAINDTRLGIRRAIDTLREDGRKAKEAADAFKAREGATIRYVSGDAVANADTLPHGDDVMAIADPPYYLTADYQQNTILGLEKVPDNWSYRATQEFLHKLVDSGDGLVYTDEAWWFKEAYSPDQQEDLFGGGSTFAKEQEILLDIINTLDHFDVAGRVVGRQEVLGVHHGHKINARTENGENGNAVRPDTIDNAGGGRGAGSPVLGVAAEPQGQSGRDGTDSGARGLNGERASVIASGRRALAREVIIQDIAASIESAANRIAGNDKAQKLKMAVGAFLPQEDSGSKRNALQDVLQAHTNAAYNNHFTDTVASIIDIRGDAAHGTTYEKGGQISPETVTDIFKALNTDGETAALYEEVFAVASALKVEYFIDRDPKDDASAYQLGGSVHYHLDHLERKSNQYIADTILHEMIHAVTTYAIDIAKGEKIVNGITVSKELKDAVAELEQIYNDNKDWIHGEYGAESMDEFIAELSTASLRKKLSEPRQGREEKSAFIKFCEAFINALRKLVGKKQNFTQNELTRALNNLDKFLTHYEEEAFAAYQEKGWEIEETIAKGATVDIDAVSRLARYSVRQVREERMADYAQFVSKNAKAWLKHAAKRLDERMKDAGYTEKVWHGAYGEDFNVFKFNANSHDVPAAYFTYKRGTAQNYAALRSMANDDEAGANTRQFYVNPGKVLDLDESENPSSFEEFIAKLQQAYEDGYNAVRVKNVLDDQGIRLDENDENPTFTKEDDNDLPTDILIVMQQPGDNAAARIKAADTVTFDDDEMPIPLEMRVDQSMSDLRFSVQMGKKAREEARRMIEKYRPGLHGFVTNVNGVLMPRDDAAIESIAAFETPKERKAALLWFCKDTIRLPEDAPKVTEAIKTAERAKVNPMQYERPGDILEEFSKFRPKEPPINPDTVPELTDKREMGNGVTTYLVQDDKAGQLAMRKIINTHWGKDANPWCLLQGDGYGNLSDGTNGRYNAWHYWQHYNALPKRVAFQDGKLLAFMSTAKSQTLTSLPTRQYDSLVRMYETETGMDAHDKNGDITDAFLYWYNDGSHQNQEWWDRTDKSHDGIPMKRVTKGETEYGESTTTETIEIMQDGTEVTTSKERVSFAPDGTRTEEIWGDGGNADRYDRNIHYPSGAYEEKTTGRNAAKTVFSTSTDRIYESLIWQFPNSRSEEITWRHDNYTDYKLRTNRDGVYVLYKYERGAFRETDVEYTSETVNAWRASAEAALRRGEAVPPLPGTESASTTPRWSVGITRPWRKDFPNATVMTTRKAILEKHGDLFTKAKAGDVEAAADLIDALMADKKRLAKVRELKRRHPKAAFVSAVHAEEATGRNKIPQMFAKFIAKAMGITADDNIVQTVRAEHSGADAWHRLTHRAQFAGIVDRGKEYILVDDHITQGGTLNELRSYIENEGGKVVDVIALTSSKGSTILVPRKETIDELKTRYPDINRLLREADIAGRVEALTNSEAEYIKTFSPDTFRDRVAQAGQERSERLRGQALDEPPSDSVARTAWSETPEERHHVRRGSAPRNTEDIITAYIAAQIIGGNNISVEDVRKIIGSAMPGTSAAQVLENANTTAENAKNRAVATASKSVADNVGSISNMLETDRLNKALSDAVTMGAKAANPETGRKLQQAIERKRIRDLQAAEGFTAAEIMAELPIDLAEAVLAAAERERTPEELAKLEEARKEREEERKKKLETEEGAEELADEEAPMREPTETERKAVDDLLDRARIRNDLEREEEERKRAEKAKRDAEEAEGSESGDNNADGGGDTTDGTTLLPEDTVRRIAPVFESADVFSWFIIELTSDKTLEKHPELPSTGEMWKSPVAVRELKKTAADILRRLAKDTLGSPSINYARNLVDRAINELESDLETKSFNSVRRKIARIYTMIWDNAHRITKNELMKELEKTVSKLTQKGRFSYTQEELDRKIPAKIERWAKWVLKYARKGEAKLQDEIAKLEKLTSANPASEDGKMPTPVELAEAADKLAVAKVYGHLKGKTTGEMRDLIDQIAAKLDGERQAFELRRAEIEEANKTIVDALVNALTQGKANRRKRAKAQGIVDRAMAAMISSIDQQMVDLVRFCTDPELRKKALEAIDELTILINEGGNRYRNTLATAQEEIHDGLKACYGDAAKGIRHLHEKLPPEIVDKFFRQSSDKPRTYGHLLQLYASCLQRDYAENVRKHGRDKQIAAMEAALTAQDKMFHTWAVNWYKHNREALSDAVEEVTGLPVIAPDELYVPVRVETEPSGIPAEVVAWSPIPSALNRRVRHGLDFDENAHFLTMVNEQAETRAQTIGYAMTGIILRDTIASRDVQTAARRNASPSDMNAVILHLRDILAQGAGQEKSVLESLKVLRKWAARFNIAWNPSSALAQPASIPVWANVLLDGKAWGAMSVLKAMGSAGTEEGRAAIAELRASDGYRARYALGWSEEVANVFANPNEPKLLSKLGAAYDKGMMLSQFTDAACSLWIAQGFYRHATDVFVRRGETIEEAKRKALALTWAAVEQTQQSGRTENLSALQRGRGKNIINAILQFKTAQVLQNSYIIRAIRDVRAGVPGAKGRLARAMFISTVWVPGYLALKGALWALIMGVKPEPDDEDEMPLWFREMLYSAVDGMAAPLFVTSAMAEAPLRKMLDLKSYGGKSGIAAIDTIKKLAYDTYDLLTDPIMLEEELTTDKIIDDIWKVIGDVSAPIRHARRAYNNWSEE